MRICIFEDQHVRGLEPLTLTRPTADLLCGLTTLGEKQSRYFGATATGHLCRPLVAELMRAADPQTNVNDPGWLRAAPTTLVNARWLPPRKSSGGLPVPATTGRNLAGSYLGTVEGEVAYAVLDTRLLTAVSPSRLQECLSDWLQSLPMHEVGGMLLARPWELIEQNPAQIIQDFEGDVDVAGFHPTGFAVVGPTDRVIIHPSARIDPMVVADTTHGPVIIGENAIVHAFTRLEGPCFIGPGSVVLGATIRGGTTIGPQCRIGGEIEASIVLGYSNKYHEGFLGHSYVGEWVNLAAGTHTSDLRCDYRAISVPVDGYDVPTGQSKLGAVIGDHTKTGLGVLLDCGSLVGPFAQILPTGGFTPRAIPGFHRAGPSGIKELTDVDRLLATADTVMRRRGRRLTAQLDALYRTISAARLGSPEVLQLRKTA
jgi:UDP-N-acetylglucosamine diphosphorylase/glucosamine-1-phosphate N-acetyltransferase